MITFTNEELTILNDALNMALASNKRMQTSKPKFATIFATIESDINALKIKINTPAQSPKQK